MSVAEIKSELGKLSPAELAEVELTLRSLKETSAPTPVDPAQFLGSLSGVMNFGPGWDAALPPEDWDALRDDSSP